MKGFPFIFNPATVSYGIKKIPDFLELTKPRLSLLSVISSLVGFHLARTGLESRFLFLHLFVGASLLAGGANALNQWAERDIDRTMKRTQKRPLPSERLSAGPALVFSVFISCSGLIYLFALVNPLSALLGVLTLVSYLFVYTPLKRKTNLATLAGGIPGALPPMIGWAAAREQIGQGAWALFAILYLWQLPHFLALAWRCREDYQKAGFPLLATMDEKGLAARRQTVLYALALIPTSLVLTFLGLTGIIYFFGALMLGLMYLAFAIQSALAPSNRHATHLFLVSIIYLYGLIFLMIIDKH